MNRVTISLLASFSSLAFATSHAQVCTPQPFPKPLLPPNPAANSDFGAAVAIHGETCVVGAPLENGEKGAIHVFGLVNGAWVKKSSFGANDGIAGDHFGTAVAIDADRIYVGAPERLQGNVSGAVYVYVRNLIQGFEVWSLEQKLVDSGGAIDDDFGAALAVDDGVLVVGAPGDDVINATQVGATCVFERIGGTWVQTYRFGAPSPLQWEQFGAAVAYENGVAVIGSPTYGGPNGIPTAHGRATIMRRSSTWNWSFEKTLDHTDTVSQRKFGAAVAISGTRIVVGAPGAADSIGGNRGGAFVFEKPFGAATWSETGSLLANSFGFGFGFGKGVAIALNQAWVGGDTEVLCFEFNSGNWALATELAVPFAELGSLPSYVDLGPVLAADNALVLIGRPALSFLVSEMVFAYHACGGSWEKLGTGTSGSAGVPLLLGAGPIQDGLADEIRLQDAKPNAPALLLIHGGAPSNLPHAGGTLYALPTNLVISLSLPADGKLALTSVLPAGLSQVPFVLQYLIADPAAKKGLALSNGLKIVTGI